MSTVIHFDRLLFTGQCLEMTPALLQILTNMINNFQNWDLVQSVHHKAPGQAGIYELPTQQTWSGLSPMRNPVHLRLWRLSLSVLGDEPSWDSGPSSIGLWSDQKFEFSVTKSPDQDLWESQICLIWVAISNSAQKYNFSFHNNVIKHRFCILSRARGVGSP